MVNFFNRRVFTGIFMSLTLTKDHSLNYYYYFSFKNLSPFGKNLGSWICLMTFLVSGNIFKHARNQGETIKIDEF